MSVSGRPGCAGGTVTAPSRMPHKPKVLTVIGTRPEAIKLAPVIRELERRADRFTSTVCLTGQHGDMVRPILDLYMIEPERDLDLMRRSQTLTDVTVGVLAQLEPVLEEVRPDWVLVQGDTTTAMAGSLAAVYAQIPVAHVEAGLRTHDIRSPFPEELNRRIVAVAAALHFAPTEWAAGNLRREGVPEERIHVTGNTIIDAFRHVAALPHDGEVPELSPIPSGEERVVLVTCHRRENLGRPIEDICWALRTIAQRHEDVHLVFPVHPNPRVQQPVAFFLGDLPNITLLPPLDYRPLVRLLERAHLLITDSGGLQEEATGIGTPVLVLRESTERPEGVEAGSARLVGSDPGRILDWADRLLNDEEIYRSMAHATSPYGTGDAATRIVEVIEAASPPVWPDRVAADGRVGSLSELPS